MKLEMVLKAVICTIALVIAVVSALHADEYGTPLLSESDQRLVTIHGNPTWSPDGQTIAFEGPGLGGKSIWLVSPDGSGLRKVYQEEEVNHISMFGIIYSPDGSKFIITSSDDGAMTIISLDMESGEINHIIDGFYPSFSPDGKLMCYYEGLDGSDSDWSIMLYDVEADDSWYLAEDIIDAYAPFKGFGHRAPSFTPDGEYVLVGLPTGLSSNPEIVSQQIFGIPVEGGDPVQLTFDDGDRFSQRRWFPRVSPDGNWVMYTELATEKESLSTSFADGSWSRCTRTPSRTRVLSFASLKSYNLYDYKQGIFVGRLEWSPSDDTFCFAYEDFFEWRPNLGNKYIRIADFTPPEEVAGSYNWVTALGGELPDDLAVDDNQPEAFATLSNFPNPFNPSTTIEFSLPDAGNAELVIYDITGRKVRELVDGFYNAGSHSIQWNAIDDAGNPVSSGVYMSQLISGDAVVNSRMTFVR